MQHTYAHTTHTHLYKYVHHINIIMVTIPLTMYREFGAIPVLINQLNYPDLKVQLAVLGALRNLSYGRLNDDNKVCKLLLASTAI